MNYVGAKAPDKCRIIARQLGLSENEVDAMYSNPGDKPIDNFSKVFAHWKSRKRLPVTWKTLLGILKTRSVNAADLSQSLESKFASQLGMVHKYPLFSGKAILCVGLWC